MGVTPYYLSLVKASGKIIWRRWYHLVRNSVATMMLSKDPLAEEAYMPVPGITPSLPDRVLFYASSLCDVLSSLHRRRKVGDPFSAPDQAQLLEGIRYIQQTESVRDVLISGGDPLTYNEKRLPSSSCRDSAKQSIWTSSVLRRVTQ